MESHSDHGGENVQQDTEEHQLPLFQKLQQRVILKYGILFVVLVLFPVLSNIVHTNDVLRTQRKQNEIVFESVAVVSSVRSRRPRIGSYYNNNDKAYPIIDIISVGSNSRPFQRVQIETFGTHPSVRHFFAISEYNDTDQSCHTNFTMDELEVLFDFCTKVHKLPENQTHGKKVLVEHAERSASRLQWYRNKVNPPGWWCAQKRPMEGFKVAMSKYKLGESVVPDYLVITDDDSWLNMELLATQLNETYPSHRRFALGGCYMHHGRLPFGGWGSIYTKATIEDLLLPSYCTEEGKRYAETHNITNKNDLICSVMDKVGMGESIIYEDSMSVTDLFVKYVLDPKFSLRKASTWDPNYDFGHCYHSDHIWAYFVTMTPVFTGGFQPYMDSVLGKNSGQCRNKGATCDANSTICHYVNDEIMEKIHREITASN